MEIDMVSEYIDKLLIGECKLTERKKSLDVLKRMIENVSIQPFTSYKDISFFIFSTSGFTDELQTRKNDHIHLIDANSMMKGLI